MRSPDFVRAWKSIQERNYGRVLTFMCEFSELFETLTVTDPQLVDQGSDRLLSLKVNGQEYRYKAKNGKADDLLNRYNSIAKQNVGMALAWVKNNSDLVQNGQQKPADQAQNPPQNPPQNQGQNQDQNGVTEDADSGAADPGVTQASDISPDGFPHDYLPSPDDTVRNAPPATVSDPLTAWAEYLSQNGIDAHVDECDELCITVYAETDSHYDVDAEGPLGELDLEVGGLEWSRMLIGGQEVWSAHVAIEDFFDLPSSSKGFEIPPEELPSDDELSHLADIALGGDEEAEEEEEEEEEEAIEAAEEDEEED